MAKVPLYARWLNSIAVARKDAGDIEFQGCEEVLAFICTKEEAGEAVKITDLVNSFLYGTGPTVHRKVTTLVDRGLINVKASKADARAKHLSLTKAGMNLLVERSKQMAQMVAGK